MSLLSDCWLVVLLLAFTCFVNRTKSELVPPESPLSGTSFSLSTRLSVVEKNGFNYMYDFEETYSNLQNSSRIDYKYVSNINRPRSMQALPAQGSIYLGEPYANSMIIIDSQASSCSSVSDHLKDFFHYNGLLELNDELPKYVKGPARILLYLNQCRNQMVRSKQRDLIVRNIPTVMYSLVPSDDSTSIQFKLMYSKNSIAATKSMPIQLIIEDNERISMFDFTKHENFLVGPQIDTLAWPIVDERAQHDLVTIEPGASCSRLLPKLELKIHNEHSFSFLASATIPGHANTVDFSVAYSRKLNILRIDRSNRPPLLKTGQQEQRPQQHMHGITTISDFQYGQKYFLPRRARNNTTNRNNSNTTRLNCVVTDEIYTRNSDPSSLGPMLFGTTRYAYLGQAQVRGMRARVYESYLGSWPQWFRQSYFHTAQELQGNNTYHRGNVKVSLPCDMMVIVYTTDEDFKPRFYNPGARLLQMEMLPVKLEHRHRFGRIVIQIRDFSWSILNSNSNTVGDLFSLTDQCQDRQTGKRANGSGSYGQIDMLLAARDERESPELERNSWINKTERRNLALLNRIMSSLKIPLPLISDLESKFVYRPRERLANLGVKFQVKKHKLDRLTRIIDKGRGVINAQYAQKFKLINNTELDDCFYLGALEQRPLLLAHRVATAECYIEIVAYSVSDLQDEQLDDLFDHRDVENIMDLFKIVHVNREAWRFPVFQSKNMILDDLYSTGSLIFHVTSKQLVVNYATTTRVRHNSSTGLDVNTDRFVGVGLVASDAPNKLLSLQPISSYKWLSRNSRTGSMSFSQCQVACLADFDCQSYSVCFNANGKCAECVLSKVDFRNPMLVQNLIEFREKELIVQTGAKKTIGLEYDEITKDKIGVRSDSLCELHNKIYSNSFNQVYGDYFNYDDYEIIEFVHDHEACARLCFERTLTILEHKLAQSHANTMNLIKNFQILDTDPELIKRSFRNHREIASNICEQFHYHEAGRLNDSASSLDLLEFLSSKSGVNLIGRPGSIRGGFCMLDYNASKSEHPRSSSTKFFAHPLHYLKGDIFFEKKFGVKLRGSGSISGEEKSALEQVQSVRHTKLNATQFELLLNSWIKRGENIQVQDHESEDETSCARSCLMQRKTLWPACKSVSVVIKRTAFGGLTFVCYLNTITLHEAVRMERFDLVEEQQDSCGDNYHMLHLDPRPSFVYDKLNEDSQLAFVASIVLASSTINGNTTESPLPVMYLFVVFLIVLSSSIVGFTLGIKLNLYTKSTRLANRFSATPTTSPLAMDIEFNHLVSRGETTADDD